MKFIYSFSFSFLICTNILFAQGIQIITDTVFHGCGSDELMNSDQQLLDKQKMLDNDIYEYLNNIPERRILKDQSYQTYTIPIVVHIVHNGGPEDISDAQVQNAIADINAKYARIDSDQIQFCLAERDPDGNATTGITRNVSILTSDTMEVNDTTLKNINRWSPTCYLNIWVIKQIVSLSMGNGVIGYAYFPSAYGTNVDGVVIVSSYFGSSPANDAVGAHEIGHYFGLYHTFQNGCGNDNCLLDGDHVCDTPPTQTTFASCDPPTNSCSTDADDTSGNDPFKTDVNDDGGDYMAYSAIGCYNNFTPGQYTRMLYFFNNVRYGMTACKSCLSPCPTPLSASITTPASSLNIMTDTTVSFTATAVNASSYQWYLTPGSILSTGLSFNYTFNIMGNYWMKFAAISNSSLCNTVIDSVYIIVTESVVTSCSGSIDLNLTNSALRLPYTNQNYSSNGFTWECWFKMDTSLANNSNTRGLINECDSVQCEDITLGFGWFDVSTGNHLIFRVDGPGECSGRNPVINDYYPPGGFILGTWYYAAGVMDYANHISKIYVNGQMVDSITNNAVPITRTAITECGYDAKTQNLANPGPPLGGEVDEVRIWNKPRTNAEILATYNTCLVGNEDSLLSYYRCNQSAGSVAIDGSINHQNATLYNGASWSPAQHMLAVNDCHAGTVTVNSATICQGTSTELIASGGVTYAWSPARGLNATTGDSITASPSVTTTYTVTAAHGCDTNTVYATVIVDTASTKTLNLGNDISMCSSATHTFNAGSGFETYRWQNGSTDSTFTAYSPGKYWVTVKNFCSSVYLSDTVYINLVPPPTLNLGNDTILCIQDTIALSYTSNGTYSTFQWSPDTTISCTHCPNPLVYPSNTTTYYLTATTADGCTNIDSILLTINPACFPPVSNFAASELVVCANSCINFINNSIHATSWQWTFYGATDSTSTGQNPQDVCYPSAGTYNVTLVSYNSIGDSSALTLTNKITVFPDPLAPHISLHHDTLFCSTDASYSSYQWYLDSIIIDGATGSFLVITNGGNYNVRVTNENGCSISAGANIVTGVDEFSENNNPFSISFNSLSHQIFIYEKYKSGNGIISIYDVLGKKVMQQEIKQGEQSTIDIAELASGIYFVRISDNERQYVQKIVVQ